MIVFLKYVKMKDEVVYFRSLKAVTVKYSLHGASVSQPTWLYKKKTLKEVTVQASKLRHR